MNEYSFKDASNGNQKPFGRFIQCGYGGRTMRSKDLDKHRRILDAAVKVFAGKGFHRSRVSEIAREAGVADGTIYLYFKNKDDILISLFEETMQEAVSRFRQEIEEAGDAPSRLERLVRLHLEEFQANPDLAAVFQVELRQSGRFMRQYRKEGLKQYLDLIGSILEDGQEEGVFGRDLPKGIVKGLIFGTLDEVVSAWVLAGGRYDLASQANIIARLLLHGIAEPPEMPA
jgi:TetR/AcrR family transcriptional regulator, fatty acid metabolism regulator protein